MKIKINNESKLFGGDFFDNSNLDDLEIHSLVKPNSKTLKEVIPLLKKETKEWIYIFDIDEKKQIARFKGAENYVNPPEEQLLRMRDKVILHNHPQDLSFSLADIQAITQYNAKKIIVITPKYTYIAERNGKDWSVDLNSKEDKDLLDEVIAITENMLIKDLQMGIIDYTQKIEDKTHHIWKDFFKLKNRLPAKVNN